MPVFKTGAFNHSATPPNGTGFCHDAGFSSGKRATRVEAFATASFACGKTGAFNHSATPPNGCGFSHNAGLSPNLLWHGFAVG
ncbi:protein of unknown function [Georgfuchsia toluolica]|uniref:Uncharacterized protein n=1 Tax=Georgfuchsia toluolica TaxID=424218 RepID=A0A916MZ85_9PROT|nr:protein of unknown function [Georgfuchsia toluolica]